MNCQSATPNAVFAPIHGATQALVQSTPACADVASRASEVARHVPFCHASPGWTSQDREKAIDLTMWQLEPTWDITRPRQRQSHTQQRIEVLA